MTGVQTCALPILKGMLYMNSVLEKQESKLFQPLPLRNNIIPKHIIIDTASLINLVISKGIADALSDLDKSKYLWDKYFNITNNNKINVKRRYFIIRII